MKLILFLIGFQFCTGDVYFHIPRGSNNRLNEASATRNNNNRIFDSQNNNRGGYNVGDSKSTASTTENDQYNMQYFYSNADHKSYMTMQWTNQHGCGGNEATDPQKQNCNIVLQFLCENDDNNVGYSLQKDALRNGELTKSQKFTNGNSKETSVQFRARYDQNVDPTLGLHEPFTWYDNCKTRLRNRGLFTADQNVKGKTSDRTRQNPNGGRSGYECPEERDYYPYWQPSPWKDIAILTDNTTHCQLYKTESFNRKEKYECVEYFPDKQNVRKFSSPYITEESCKANGGKWTAFSNYLEIDNSKTSEAQCRSSGGVERKWALPYNAKDINKKQCLVMLPPLDCQQAPWTRTNNLGDTRDNRMPSYTWTLPYFPSGKDRKCVVRIRYNISTDDYDPFNTDSKLNGMNSPVKNNPIVDVDLNGSPLRLAINTAQFGRTFQDRSHIIRFRPRPNTISSGRLFNLNVMGKRGNIAQVYPGVPYDFAPTESSLKVNDLVHIQWTGSNTHNNGQNQGDGQVGSDGRGASGTDRQNFVEIESLSDNIPAKYSNRRLWSGVKVVWRDNSNYLKMSNKDHAIALASSGYFQCEKSNICQGDSVEKKANLNPLLNNSSPSFDGMVIKFVKPATYYFMSTRNNDFSVRSQKGKIVVA